MQIKRKIVIHTNGSFGDINPYLSIAIIFKKRGYFVVMATSDIYRNYIENFNIKFEEVAPSMKDFENNEDDLKKSMEFRSGSKFLLKKIIFPSISKTFADLFNICKDADLLINHSNCFIGPMVAKKLNLLWVSCVLFPVVYLSKFDPSVISNNRILMNIPKCGILINSFFNYLAKNYFYDCSKILNEFKKEIGIYNNTNPIFDDIHSPFLCLSLFSNTFAKNQKDWPKNSLTTGFCFLDEKEIEDEKLNHFLVENKKPILFTLGSSVVKVPGDFYKIAIKVIEKNNLPAVFLIGNKHKIDIPQHLKKTIYCTNYLPFNQIIKECSLIVNQCGIGTMGQILRHGIPNLGVPHLFDQFDNAYRCKKMGVGDFLLNTELSEQTLNIKINNILNNDSFSNKAKEVSNIISNEHGNEKTVDAILKFLESI